MDQRRPVALIISSATFCPAAANSLAPGFWPTSIRSASATLCHVGNAAPGTMRASMILPSLAHFQNGRDAHAGDRQRIAPAQLDEGAVRARGSFGKRTAVSSSSGLALV